MKRFFLGVLAGVIIAGVSVVVLFFAAVKFSSRQPSLPDRTVLTVNLEGPIPEISPASLPLPAFEDRSPLTVSDYYRILRSAARDPRVQGVVVKAGGIGSGWASLDEVRQGLAEVKKAGKPVYAWLRSPGLREYYVASVADQVIVSPEDLIDVKGIRMEATYLKGTLDKLGVQMEVEHAGKYKDAGDVFTRTSMSPETREALNKVLDSLYPRIVSTLAQGRKKSPEQMLALIDQGPFLAHKAKELGLIDGLDYERSVSESMEKKTGVKISSFVSARRYLESGDLKKAPAAKRVALLIAAGDIVRGGGEDSLSDGQFVSPAAFNAVARRVGDDNSVDAVVVRVDSPGGDAVASDELLHALQVLSKKKATVISMGDLAASGGYMMSMTGDPVIASPYTLTGSIGVVYGKPYIRGLLDKIGVSTEILKRGRFADIDSLTVPMNPDSRTKLREGIDYLYQDFIAKVAAGRKRPPSAIEPVAQGRVWLGPDAKDQGLVDELGGIDSALSAVRKKAGWKTDQNVELAVYPKRKSMLELLFRRAEEAATADPEIRIRRLLEQAGPGVAAVTRGGFLSVMPYRISVN